MRHLASIRWAALALALCGLWSCSGSRTASESTSQGAAAVLDAYEGVRSLLADDKVQGVSDAAAQLADAARSASASAAERLRPSLGDIANTADQLRQAPPENLAEIRKRFGPLSRSVIALVAAEPSLATGRHVFECPMAEGYGKWVQRTDQISNPYFGKEMLECGSASKWTD